MKCLCSSIALNIACQIGNTVYFCNKVCATYLLNYSLDYQYLVISFVPLDIMLIALGGGRNTILNAGDMFILIA